MITSMISLSVRRRRGDRKTYFTERRRSVLAKRLCTEIAYLECRVTGADYLSNYRFVFQTRVRYQHYRHDDIIYFSRPHAHGTRL